MNNKAVYRTAPATPGLLNIQPGQKWMAGNKCILSYPMTSHSTSHGPYIKFFLLFLPLFCCSSFSSKWSSNDLPLICAFQLLPALSLNGWLKNCSSFYCTFHSPLYNSEESCKLSISRKVSFCYGILNFTLTEFFLC